MGEAGQAASAVLGYGCGRGENLEISEGWGHGRAPASTPGTAWDRASEKGPPRPGERRLPGHCWWPQPLGSDHSANPCSH